MPPRPGHGSRNRTAMTSGIGERQTRAGLWWPRLARLGCLGLVVTVLACYGIYYYRQEADRAERNRRAPLVVDVDAEGCALSPSGRYLWVDRRSVVGGE